MTIDKHSTELPKEYDVLGCRIKIQQNADKDIIASTIEYVLNEASNLKKKSPNLDDKQVATLLALQFAREKLCLERDFRDDLSLLHRNAVEAMNLIDRLTTQ